MMIRLTLFEQLLRRLRILPTPVMDVFGDVLFGRGLAIAVRRGMFQALSSGPLDLRLLADRIGLHPEGVALIADACVVGRYLKKEGNTYSLAAEGKKWFLPDSGHSIVNLIIYFETLYARWGSLERSLERGRPERRYYDLFTADDWHVYVLGMRDLARLILPEIIGKLRFGRGASLLVDLGGSHGLFAIECCKRHAGLNAVVMDFPAATMEAGRFIREAGMSGRVRTEAGDFMTRTIPSPADGVLLFNVVHGLSDEANRDLVRRSMEALRPGGKLYILDQMKDNTGRSGIGRFIPLMVGLNLLNEIGGTSYNVEQVRSWCEGAAVMRRRGLRLPGVTLLEVIR